MLVDPGMPDLEFSDVFDAIVAISLTPRLNAADDVDRLSFDTTVELSQGGPRRDWVLDLLLRVSVDTTVVSSDFIAV